MSNRTGFFIVKTPNINIAKQIFLTDAEFAEPWMVRQRNSWILLLTGGYTRWGEGPTGPEPHLG
jgi:hypothetical protein